MTEGKAAKGKTEAGFCKARKVPRDEFMAGYLIAVSNIMNLHGEGVIAEDVLLQAGVDRSVLKGLDLCDYDLRPLNRLFDEIERKDSLEATRRDRAALAAARGLA